MLHLQLDKTLIHVKYETLCLTTEARCFDAFLFVTP